ncbi:MAG: hypothetical protein RXQ68_03370, partial [Candidatus Nanopusillus sp.]
QEIENDYKMNRNGELNITQLLEKRINRLLEHLPLLLDKFEVLCNYTNNSLFICNILPELNQTLTPIIQEVMNENISTLLNMIYQLEDYNWEVIRSMGENYEEEIIGEHMKHFRREIKNWIENWNWNNWNWNNTNWQISIENNQTNINNQNSITIEINNETININGQGSMTIENNNGTLNINGQSSVTINNGSLTINGKGSMYT